MTVIVFSRQCYLKRKKEKTKASFKPPLQYTMCISIDHFVYFLRIDTGTMDLKSHQHTQFNMFEMIEHCMLTYS